MINDKSILKKKNQRGIAVYCAAAILSIVLAIALGVGLITAERIKMLNQAGDSVKALMAAQTGAEWALYEGIDESNYSYKCPVEGEKYICDRSIDSDGNGRVVEAYLCGSAGEFLCVKSTGAYRGANRAVRIKM